MAKNSTILTFGERYFLIDGLEVALKIRREARDKGFLLNNAATADQLASIEVLIEKIKGATKISLS